MKNFSGKGEKVCVGIGISFSFLASEKRLGKRVSPLPFVAVRWQSRATRREVAKGTLCPGNPKTEPNFARKEEV
jgi:hypothetical protein